MFAGLSGNERDWITIVLVGTPLNKYSEFRYIKGTPEGILKFSGLSSSPDPVKMRAFYYDLISCMLEALYG